MKKYIKSILSGTNMIHTVSTKKTECGHIMTEFYFFKIFIESLKTAEINVRIEHEILPFSSIEKINVQKSIVFNIPSGETYKVLFDTDKLNEKLQGYNLSVSNMSFMESTMELIDIFLDLLI